MTVEMISVERPQDLAGLFIQYQAIYWWVREDDNVLDGSMRRWLDRFGRHLRRLIRRNR